MKNLDMIDSRWLEQVSGGRGTSHGTTRSTSVNNRLGTLGGYGTLGYGTSPLGLGLNGGLPLLGGGLFGNNFAVQQAIADKKQQEQTMLCLGLVCALKR